MSLLRRVGDDLLLYVANHTVAKVPLHFVRLWFYRRIMRYEIGPGSSVFLGARFDCRGGLTIGRNSTVNQNCRLDSRAPIRIGDNVSISADVVILTADHDLRSVTAEGRCRPITIGDHAFIGTRAMLLPGVRVGRGGAVGAGSVVTRDVPDHSIVAGAPARPIGTRPANLEYSAAYRRLFA